MPIPMSDATGMGTNNPSFLTSILMKLAQAKQQQGAAQNAPQSIVLPNQGIPSTAGPGTAAQLTTSTQPPATGQPTFGLAGMSSPQQQLGAVNPNFPDAMKQAQDLAQSQQTRYALNFKEHPVMSILKLIGALGTGFNEGFHGRPISESNTSEVSSPGYTAGLAGKIFEGQQAQQGNQFRNMALLNEIDRTNVEKARQRQEALHQTTEEKIQQQNADTRVSSEKDLAAYRIQASQLRTAANNAKTVIDRQRLLPQIKQAIAMTGDSDGSLQSLANEIEMELPNAGGAPAAGTSKTVNWNDLK